METSLLFQCPLSMGAGGDWLASPVAIHHVVEDSQLRQCLVGMKLGLRTQSPV